MLVHVHDSSMTVTLNTNYIKMSIERSCVLSMELKLSKGLGNMKGHYPHNHLKGYKSIIRQPICLTIFIKLTYDSGCFVVAYAGLSIDFC